MPPSSALSVLDLRADDVWVIAQAAEGYGNFLQSTAEPGAKVRAATMKIRAAGCWCLANPMRAPHVFSEASRLYEDLGHPFAIPAAICAGRQELPSVDWRQSVAPDDWAYRSLWGAWSTASSKNAAPAAPAMSASGHEWIPVGQLGIPVRFYLDFSRDVNFAVRDRNHQLLARSLSQLLQRGTEPLKLAMTDRYHWRRIMSGVMPVEPELLAIGRIAHRALDAWDEDTLTQLGLPPSSVERMPLWIARMLEEPPGRVPPPTELGGHPAPMAPADEDGAEAESRSVRDAHQAH